jgi:hypothetical protein
VSNARPPPTLAGEGKLGGTTGSPGEKKIELRRGANALHRLEESGLQLLGRGEIAADAHLSSVSRNPIPTGRRSPLEPIEFTGVHKHSDPPRTRTAGFQQTADHGSSALSAGSMSSGGTVEFGWASKRHRDLSAVERIGASRRPVGKAGIQAQDVSARAQARFRRPDE